MRTICVSSVVIGKDLLNTDAETELKITIRFSL